MEGRWANLPQELCVIKDRWLGASCEDTLPMVEKESPGCSRGATLKPLSVPLSVPLSMTVTRQGQDQEQLEQIDGLGDTPPLLSGGDGDDSGDDGPGTRVSMSTDSLDGSHANASSDEVLFPRSPSGRSIARRDCPDCPAGDGGRDVESRQGLNVVVGTHHQRAAAAAVAADEMTEEGRTGEYESKGGGAGVISAERHSEDQWGARHEPAPAYGDAVVRAPNKLTQGNTRRSEAVQGTPTPTPTPPCAITPRVLHVGVAVSPPKRARRGDKLETTASLPASKPINADSPTDEVAGVVSAPVSHGYTSLSAETTQTLVTSIKGEREAEEAFIAPESCARVLQGSKRRAARASARSGEVSPELEQLVPLAERMKESPPATDRNRSVAVKRCERCTKCVKAHAGDVGYRDQIHRDKCHQYKADHDGSHNQRPNGVSRRRPPGWDLATTSTTPVQSILNAASSRKVEGVSVAKPPCAKAVAAASVPGDLTTLLTPVTEATEAVTAEDRSAASCGTRGTARNTPSSASASASPGTCSSGQGQASASTASGAMVGIGRRDRRGTVVVVDHQNHYNRRTPDRSPALGNPRCETHGQVKGRSTSDGGNRNLHRAMWSCCAVDTNGDSSGDINDDINDDSNRDSAVDSAVDSAASGSGIDKRRRHRKNYDNHSSQDPRSLPLERRSPPAIVAAVAVQDGSGPTISTFSSRSAAISYREPRVCGSGSGSSGIGNGIGSVNSSGNGSGCSYLAAMGRRSRCSARYKTVIRLSEMARAARATTRSPTPIAMAERARWGKGRETPKEAARRKLLQRRAEYAFEVKMKTREAAQASQAQAERPPPSREKQTLGSSEVTREDYGDTQHCSLNTSNTTSLEAAGLARENVQCAVGSNNNGHAAGRSGPLGQGRGHRDGNLDGRTSEKGIPPLPCETLPQTTVARTGRALCSKRPDGIPASSNDGRGSNAGYEACHGCIENDKAKDTSNGTSNGTSKGTRHATGRGNCRGFSSDPGQKGRVGSVKQAVRATEAPGEEERLVESIARLDDLLQEGPGSGYHDARHHLPSSRPRRRSYFPPDRSAEVRGVGGMRREPSITQMGSYKKPPHDEGVAKTRVRRGGGKGNTRSAPTPAAARSVDDDGGISPTREMTTLVAQAPGVLAAGGGSTRTALTKFPPLFPGSLCPRDRRCQGPCPAEDVNWPRSSHHPESRRTPPISPTPNIPSVCELRHPSRTTPPAGRRPHNGSDRSSVYGHEHLRAQRRCRSPPSPIYECHHECTADVAENDRYNHRWGSGWNGGRDRYQRRYPDGCDECDGCRYPARGEQDCSSNQQSSPRPVPVVRPTANRGPRHEMDGGVSYPQGVEGDEHDYPTCGVGYHQSAWSERQLERGSWTQAPEEEQGFDDGRCAGYPTPTPTQWDRRDGGQHVLRAPVGYVY